eukprot:scaffold14939_cov215-Amphora_coffeaeformis.AAC.3
MRWSAPSADGSRFKSLPGCSVLSLPYKSCATSLNCATYQRTCVAGLQGRIYNQFTPNNAIILGFSLVCITCSPLYSPDLAP